MTDIMTGRCKSCGASFYESSPGARDEDLCDRCAQPQAREEAQPVAWSLDFGMGVNAMTTFSTKDKAEYYANGCIGPAPTVVPLYTTPPSQPLAEGADAEKLREEGE